VKTIVYVMFLALCAFLIVGWVLDWYAVQDIRSTPGRHRLEIEINTEKIQQDIERGRKKARRNVEANAATRHSGFAGPFEPEPGRTLIAGHCL
jgi:hypothetical protein